jgi:hypothetical protein
LRKRILGSGALLWRSAPIVPMSRRVQCSAVATASTMKASAAHSVRAARADSSMEATMSSVGASASLESPGTTTAALTGEAAAAGMARPVVGAVIEVIVVVSFMTLPITVPPIAKAVPIVVPIVKVTKVIKIMVEVAEE